MNKERHKLTERINTLTARYNEMVRGCVMPSPKAIRIKNEIKALTCERDVVRMLYDRADSVKVRQTLECLFGSKCLPDESNLSESLTGSEPKPSEPNNEGTRQAQCVPKNAESGTRSFDRILKDSSRGHNRLHIAAMVTASIYSSDTIAQQFNSIEAIVRKALDIADTLIAEAEKGGDK